MLSLYPGVMAPAAAGEIPGLPGNLPPTVDRTLDLTFSNDFLGRGGSIDDFRTQQLILGASVGDGWVATLDHSILTGSDTASAGRIDQLSASVGYRLLERDTADSIDRVVAGFGVRASGDFAGARIQNGFHRLAGSDVESLPYVAVQDTDATGWIDANHYRWLIDSFGNNDAWRFGYWLRGSALLTSDGQADTAIGAYGVFSRRSFDGWLGLRRDWRSGYDADVLRETADAESDLAVVIGLRWGPLVLESVQQVNDDASYGQLRLVSQGYRPVSGSAEPDRLAIDAGFKLPDVRVSVAGRYRSAFLNRKPSRWLRLIMITADFGEPQYEDDTSLYVQTRELGAGVEWERRLDSLGRWVSMYGSIGPGIRRERLVGDDVRAGEESETATRGVALAAVGLRFDAAAIGDRWRYRLQLGVHGSIPFDDARLQIGESSSPVQDTTLAVFLGMSFAYH